MIDYRCPNCGCVLHVPGQEWIPVSERLPWPEGRKPYLITEAHYHPEYNGRFVRIDWYDARDDEIAPMWDEHREKDGIRVVAWMPIPEPFKGGDPE